MKPTRQIELVFETGLVFCFGYGLGDGELQDSFRESLTIKMRQSKVSLIHLESVELVFFV